MSRKLVDAPMTETKVTNLHLLEFPVYGTLADLVSLLSAWI